MGGVKAISNDYRIDANGATGTKIPKRYISLNQGFFVYAFLDATLDDTTPSVTGGNITFKNSQRVFKTETSDPSISFRNSNANRATDEREKFRIMIQTPSGYYRQLLVGADTLATDNFDIGFDASLIDDNNEDGFWMLNQSKLVIQAVNSFNLDRVLPLGVRVAEGGLIKFSLDDFENLEELEHVYLHDKETGVYRDLRVHDYEVNIALGEHLNRFEIVFNNSVLNVATNVIDESIDVWYSNSQNGIIVKNPKQERIESITMFNVLGQGVYNSNVSSNKVNYNLETGVLSTGGYIIKVKTSKGILTTKVLVK
jgi:6-pyruvoyl-tetrahydropterin synthase